MEEVEGGGEEKHEYFSLYRNSELNRTAFVSILRRNVTLNYTLILFFSFLSLPFSFIMSFVSSWQTFCSYFAFSFCLKQQELQSHNFLIKRASLCHSFPCDCFAVIALSKENEVAAFRQTLSHPDIFAFNIGLFQGYSHL